MAREKMLRPRPQPISLRLHAGQRDRIWGLADMEGRTLNDMVCSLLDLGMMRGDESFGSYQGYKLACALFTAAEAAAAKHGADRGMWLYQPDFFQVARAAMNQVLDMIDPAGSVELKEAVVEVEQARKRHAAGGARG